MFGLRKVLQKKSLLLSRIAWAMREGRKPNDSLVLRLESGLSSDPNFLTRYHLDYHTSQMSESCRRCYIQYWYMLFHQSFLQVVALMVFRVWMLGGHLPYFTKQDNPASFSDSLATRIMTYWYLIAFNSWLLLSPSVLSYDWQMGSIPLVESLWDSRNLATLMCIVIAVLLVYSSVVSNKTDVSTEDWPSSPGTPPFAVLIVQTSYSETYSVYCLKKGKLSE